MGDSQPDVRAIFGRALELDVSAGRDGYLDEACGGDAALRAEVEGLLVAAENAGSFMVGPATAATPTSAFNQLAEAPGTIIGPYKLLQKLGEGGMGVVFMAEQMRPVHRVVALKIIKPGMDSRQVIARFEAERQALAMMDHPNIAKVLDGSTTDSGRPYFVMELVKGVPITEYCDHNHLSLRERLELFRPVCGAVQHAHQKGVIHRDIKPTNVLVTEYDNRAVPKVIDFGVAKATAQKLTDRTMFTEFGQVIGTVEYMSPEQAKFNQLDIDTRSDIYSLGVLLYELLTGSTPFERDRLRDAAFDEVLRIIREEEPPKPSTRLSTSDTLPSIAANRHTEPTRLSKDLRRELDWIVMKCLEKDRNRRYETANALAHDIERHLTDEPVHACPPSAAYRFRKFARRNKASLAVASAVVTMLLAFVTSLAISNRLIAAARAQAEADRDEKAKALREREAALSEAQVQRVRAEDNFLKARTAVAAILVRAATGQGYWRKLSPDLRSIFAHETVKFYESLLQDSSSDPSLQFETAMGYRGLGALHHSAGETEQAENFIRRSMKIMEAITAEYKSTFEYRHQWAYSHFVLGAALQRQKRHSEAIANFQKAIELYKQLLAENPDNSDFYYEVRLPYMALLTSQRHDGASQDVEKTGKEIVHLLHSAPAFVAVNRPRVGQALWNAGLRDDAVAVWQDAIEGWQKAIRQQTKEVDDFNNLAWVLATSPAVQLRDPERAVELAKKAVELNPNDGNAWNTLGAAAYSAGDWKPAVDALAKSIELRQGGDSFDFIFLAMAHWRLGHKDESRKWYDRAVAEEGNIPPEDLTFPQIRAEAAELLGVTQPPSDAERQHAAEKPPNPNSDD